jgi:leucyl aminopeptidase (aminopeptidase T)
VSNIRTSDATPVPDDRDAGRWSQLAKAILARSLGLRRGQGVLIVTWNHGLSAAEALETAAHRLGIRATTLLISERAFFDAQENGRSPAADAVSRPESAALAASDGFVQILGPEDYLRLDRLPPASRRRFDHRTAEYWRIVQQHSIPSIMLLAASVTKNAARSYGVNFESWRSESLASSLVAPRILRRAAVPFVRAFRKGRRLTVTHPNGTHLDLGLAGLTPFVDDGVVDTRDLTAGHYSTVLPAGLVQVTLDERVAEGRFVSNRPSRHRRGLIRGFRWNFQDGRLVDFRVGAGRSLFETPYRRAGPERDRPAMLDIGLNPRIRDFPLAEDQALGLVTLYIGHNEDYGGRTRGSFREYALLEGADLFVDDRPVLRAGRPV